MNTKCWLDGKTAIVTGASGGMGAGIAATLIKKHGCTVIGVARSEPKMLKFIEELGDEYKDKFSYRLFDVSVLENWENFAKEIEESGVKPDILINNAGILPKFKRFDRYSYDEINKAMDINFYSCIYSTKTLLPFLLTSKTPKPTICTFSPASRAEVMDSKAALKGFTEALRVEFAGKMYVSLVCPGFTKTDIFRNQGESAEADKGQKVMNMISTDCDKMVRMIMRGIEYKYPMQVRGFDAHAMSTFNRLMPVYGSTLFSAVMKMANVDIFKEVFSD